MIYLYSGTDTKKAREALQTAVKKTKAEPLRITDASTPPDLRFALSARGMFDPPAGGRTRVVILDGIFANEEMRVSAAELLPSHEDSDDLIFILEEKIDAATKKLLEKKVKEWKKFEGVKEKKDDNFFAIVNALQSGKKKDLWIVYQRELAADKAPEMVHGALFWAAKQMVLKGRDVEKGKKLVAELAELPHASRRKGEELEYALERFILSRV